jgi:acyl-CoA thioesterase-1
MLRFVHWLLAAFVFAGTPACAARTVMVFGDSLSAAYNLDIEQGWVRILARRIEAAKLPWTVVNASITGETTAGGLRRIPEDLQRHKPSLVIIELGANDALRGQPVAGMRSNLQEMVRQVKKARAEPVLVGMMIPPNYGIDYAVGFHGMYAAVAKKNALMTSQAQPPFQIQSTDQCTSALTQPWIGLVQPPRNRIGARNDTRIMFAYSVRKNTANGAPEYSTWKPATISDSPSATSNGARLVSATPETK